MEYNNLVKFMSAPKATGVIQYPSKKWGIVGSIPVELTQIKTTKLGQEYRDSLVFETQEDAKKALVNLGYSTKDGINYHKEAI